MILKNVLKNINENVDKMSESEINLSTNISKYV